MLKLYIHFCNLLKENIWWVNYNLKNKNGVVLHLCPSHGFHPRSRDWSHGYQTPASSATPLWIKVLATSPSAFVSQSQRFEKLERTNCAEENAGMRSGQERLKAHTVATAFAHIFTSLKRYTFWHWHCTDTSRLEGWITAEGSHTVDLLVEGQHINKHFTRLTCVTTILQSDALPPFTNSSRMYWGTWVVFPQPVAPRMMTTGLL